MTKVEVFNVGMTCGGCSGAVSRILGKIDGVSDVNANVDTKIVRVTCEDGVNSQTLLDALNKWSTASKKTVAYVGSEEYLKIPDGKIEHQNRQFSFNQEQQKFKQLQVKSMWKETNKQLKRIQQLNYNLLLPSHHY